MKTKPTPQSQPIRCGWAQSELMILYHDVEWGVPVHDDTKLFEFLILEGAQAGLSWETILNKRESYRAAFDGFDAERVARYDLRKIEAIAEESGHRAKSLESRSGGAECAGTASSAGGSWQFRQVHLAIRRREAAH